MDGSELSLAHSPTAHALAAGKESRDVEITVERSDRSRRTILFNVGPVRGDRNEILGTVTVAQDINGWKLTTDTLLQTAMQEALQRFATDTAHRYRNLFATISSNLAMARSKAGDNRLDELLRMMGRTTDKGLALANQLLSFARNSNPICEMEQQGSFDRLFEPGTDEHPLAQKASSDRWTCGSGGTALLVDDDSALRTVAADALTTIGFVVLGMACKESALKIARSDRPLHLAVVNVGIVPVKGIEILREIRSIRPEIGILLITAHSIVPEYLSDLGPDVVVLKMPFRVEELANGIHAAMTLCSGQSG
jgi:CheY-like chemotaxis protein